MDSAVIEKLMLENSEEIGPSEAPIGGELLMSVQRYRTPHTILLQERDGVWFHRQLKETGEWEPVEYYVTWHEIWKKHAPIFKLAVEELPFGDLDERIEVLTWLPIER